MVIWGRRHRGVRWWRRHNTTGMRTPLAGIVMVPCFSMLRHRRKWWSTGRCIRVKLTAVEIALLRSSYRRKT